MKFYGGVDVQIRVFHLHENTPCILRNILGHGNKRGTYETHKLPGTPTKVGQMQLAARLHSKRDVALVQ